MPPGAVHPTAKGLANTGLCEGADRHPAKIGGRRSRGEQPVSPAVLDKRVPPPPRAASPCAAARRARQRERARRKTDRDIERRPEGLERGGEVVEANSDDGRPEDAAGGVEDEEAAPVHLHRAGQEGGLGAKDRDEAAEEDDLAAVAIEQVAADLQPVLIDADVVAVAAQQPVAAGAADQVADVVADGRSGCSGGDLRRRCSAGGCYPRRWLRASASSRPGEGSRGSRRRRSGTRLRSHRSRADG